jgi:hypothetical protein
MDSPFSMEFHSMVVNQNVNQHKWMCKKVLFQIWLIEMLDIPPMLYSAKFEVNKNTNMAAWVLKKLMFQTWRIQVLDKHLSLIPWKTKVMEWYLKQEVGLARDTRLLHSAFLTWRIIVLEIFSTPLLTDKVEKLEMQLKAELVEVAQAYLGMPQAEALASTIPHLRHLIWTKRSQSLINYCEQKEKGELPPPLPRTQEGTKLFAEVPWCA